MDKIYSNRIKIMNVIAMSKIRFICMAISMGTAISCSNSPIVSGELPVRTVVEKVVLVPGDEVEIKFAYWPELDDVQMIRQDGKISLQLVDEVEAAGLTPVELDQKLTELYAADLKDPEIAVIVRSKANEIIHIGGEVKSPGSIPYVGRMNLLEAIIAGGGFENLSANPENVIVYRQRNRQLVARSFNVESLLYSPESEVMELEPNDIVYVTRLGIDRANQWVDQHINRMIPGNNLVGNAILYSTLR